MAETKTVPGRGSPLGVGRDETATSAAVREMFGQVARRYDFLNHLLSMGTDIAWRNATTRALESVLSKPGSRVADLCCGTGDLSFCLGRKSKGVVLGGDFCHPMLSVARQKAARTNLRVHFLE